jgi:hypothetical protein
MSISISKTVHHMTAQTKVAGARSLREKIASQALQNFNQHTLELYAQQKAKVKNQLGQKIPVLLANQNHLISRYGGIRKEVEYIPESYHVLKALAHIPIAIHTVRQLENAQASDQLIVKLEGLFRPYYSRSPLMQAQGSFTKKPKVNEMPKKRDICTRIESF